MRDDQKLDSEFLLRFKDGLNFLEPAATGNSGAIIMFKFTDQDPDFWIQLKGENAGKPLRTPIANSIGVKTDPEFLFPDFLFYTVLYLFTSGQFRPMLKGSVVPYIRNSDITVALVNHWTSQKTKPHFFIHS